MRSFIFGFIPFCLFMLGARWYYVCQVHHLCGDENTELITGDNPTVSLNSGEESILSDYDQFLFKPGLNKPELTENNEEFLDKVADYLNLKENKNITITGNYLNKEKDIKFGMLENLGLSRAAEVKELLMERGIDEDRFTMDYNMIDSERLNNSVAFDVFDNANEGISDDENGATRGLARLKFTFHDMTFSDANFASDSDVFKPLPQCKLYADSVNIYLDANPDQSLIIIGHTDSQASDDYNMDLGERRAENAKKYFAKLGVKKADIKTISMGESQPTKPNDTPEGRQKNRRVNFKIE